MKMTSFTYHRFSFSPFPFPFPLSTWGGICLLLVLSSLSSLFLTVSLHAQNLRCTGTACNQGINSNQINELGVALRNGFGKKFAKRTLSAHNMVNIASTPYIGGVDLGLVTAGGQINVGIEKIEDRTEKTSSGASISKLDFNGIATQGLTYGGVSLGGILGIVGASNDFFDRINLFFGKSRFEAHLSALLNLDKTKYSFRNTYAGIRYQLIHAIGFSLLAKWQGLALHYGYIESFIDIEIEDADSDAQERFTIAGVGWRGENEFAIRSKAKTHVIELHTGVRVLFFLSATLGFGVAYTNGETEVDFDRTGNLYPGGVELTNATLTADITNFEHVSSLRTFYYKPGLEFNLPFFRIGVEITYQDKKTTGYGISMRIDI